ncbi:MAG: serine/threonine-protein kinase, partial [Chthoniobacteraceae bacterium]
MCPRCIAALNLGADTAFTAEPAAPMPSPTPEELAPHFPQLEIIECLGRGGMGVVYKARQTSLGRLVALKLLAPERIGDAKFAERFAQEAKALAALNHPNIVTIYDFGQAGGFFYLLMEFVDGVNLRQAMKVGRFTPEQALAIVPPVCEALQYAHEHGIVHRDIKPENLLMDKEGRVKIADFGVAKILHANDPNVGGAESQPAGTPQYMAPEQKDHRRTDHRADIYSLGVVLYELLTGELPADQLQPPSRKVQIDVRLDEIVLRALEKAPELRFQTASEFRTLVEAATNEIHDAAARTAHLPGGVSPTAWKPPTTGWGYLIGVLFGLTFTSRLAFKLANLSALGFLAFLGFAPFPGMHGCFGFAGFFGLMGVAFMVEMANRRKANAAAFRSPATRLLGVAMLVAAIVLIGIVFAKSYREASSPSGVISFDVTPVEVSNNVVVVDVTTELGRGNAELRAVLDGPQLPAGTEAALRKKLSGAFTGTLVKPTPHAGNHPWRILTAGGRQTWRLGFVLPDAGLARDAFESLQPIGPLPAVADRTFSGTLFEVRNANGQAFRAALQVALPFTSIDPDWVSVFGQIQRDESTV